MTWPLNTTLLCTFGKESTCNAGNPGSIPGLGRYPGEGLGYPLQYSDLENSMDYTVHGVENSWTQLSNFHFFYYVLLIFRVHVNVWQKTTKLCKAIILQLKKINLKNSSVGKESACHAGDSGSIPGSGRSTAEGIDHYPTPVFLGFPCGSAGKESACNAGDLGSIPGLGRSPGEGKGYPLQYSGLENSTDCIVNGVTESDTTEWLSLYFTWLQANLLLLCHLNFMA